MLESAVPVQAGRTLDYDLLSHLFLMAYDGFVINQRLNDLRDIERLVDTVCDMMMEPTRSAAPDERPVTKPKASRTRQKRAVQQDT